MKATGIYVVAALAIGAGFGAIQARTISAAPHLVCHEPARAMARLELLFGTSLPDGGTITETEWSSFLDHEVTPRFPAGLTVLNGPGQWRTSDGKLTMEQSKILVVWLEPSAAANSDIEAIRSAYKTQFAQESVMRVDSTSCVSF